MTIIAWAVAALSLLFIIAAVSRPPKSHDELKTIGVALLYFAGAPLVSIEVITN